MAAPGEGRSSATAAERFERRLVQSAAGVLCLLGLVTSLVFPFLTGFNPANMAINIGVTLGVGAAYVAARRGWLVTSEYTLFTIIFAAVALFVLQDPDDPLHNMLFVALAVPITLAIHLGRTTAAVVMAVATALALVWHTVGLQHTAAESLSVAIVLAAILSASTLGPAMGARERRRAEEAERRALDQAQLVDRMFDSVHVLVAFMDREFNFLRVNQAYAESDGHPPSYFVGKNHFALFPHAENEALFRQVVATGQPVEVRAKPFEYEGHPERGTTYWDWRLQPVREPDGKVSGLILTLLEVTDVVEAQRRALELQAHEAEVRRLKELDRVRSSLMNMVAHELKNPLTPLMVEAAVLRMESASLPPASRNAVEVMDRNVRRVNELIEDLLDSSRLDAGTVRLAVAPTDLGLLARESAESYRTVAAGLGIAIDLDLHPAEVRIDRQRVGQVLYNLLSNAVKYTPPGGRVTLSTSLRDGFGWITVRDTGLGLTPEQQGKLFKPLSTVHAPAHAGFKASGLGLYITKSLVELHGGTIAVESDGAGKGSVFTVRLPVAGPPKPTGPAPAPDQPT